MAFAKDKNLLASAGFDKNIFIWDIPTQAVVKSTAVPKSNPKLPNQFELKMIFFVLQLILDINDNKYSIYSLAINDQATLLASGSPENCVRIWDPRTCAKSMKLKGHSHNIRALALNRDGTQVITQVLHLILLVFTIEAFNLKLSFLKSLAG